MTSNAEGGGVKVKDPSERGVCEQNLKFIDQSDNEEEDGRDFKVENLAPKSNGAGYSEVPQDTKRVCPYPDSADTACGFWIFRGPVLQKFANKKAYIILYGLVGSIISASYAYFNGTITTMEKRYKIPSRNTGIISVGNDISALFLSAIVSYYGGKGHRPRWIAFGLFTVVIFCLLNALPHFLYGPGENALTLTTEYGAQFDHGKTLEILEQQKKKTLCQPLETGGGGGGNGTSNAECDNEEGNLMPQVIFFFAQFVSGIGGSLYYTLGISYIDDNVKKSKTPVLISFSYFFRLLGPALGYSLASACLKMYISPSLHPTVTDKDPRWLGAWWMGWILLGFILALFTVMLGMFPKILPRAAARKQQELERQALTNKVTVEPEETSFQDMLATFKRLLRNPTLMFNNLASVFYFFGYMPYWIFMPKYIEIQYHQSSSVSSLVTGTVALVFSAIGVLLSGVTISKFKPRARYMAGWNVMVGCLTVVGLLSYILLGCPASDNNLVSLDSSRSWEGDFNATVSETCFSHCRCDYVKYSPVCGQDGRTYISACHAGCTDQVEFGNVTKLFTQCSCISGDHTPSSMATTEYDNNQADESLLVGTAKPGPCAVDCYKQFYVFLAVMCFIKFTGSTGRATNFLVSVRCVEDKDKPVSMGFSAMFVSLFAFIPSPIFFGAVLDKACIVWGKTCTGKGNCWLYDSGSLRYNLNLVAALFVAMGTLFDVIVWYYVKGLKIFDDEVQDRELVEVAKEEELIAERQ